MIAPNHKVPFAIILERLHSELVPTLIPKIILQCIERTLQQEVTSTHIQLATFHILVASDYDLAAQYVIESCPRLLSDRFGSNNSSIVDLLVEQSCVCGFEALLGLARKRVTPGSDDSIPGNTEIARDVTLNDTLHMVVKGKNLQSFKERTGRQDLPIYKSGIDIVKYLRQSGADVNSKDHRGTPILHSLLQGLPYYDESKGMMILEFILDEGADPNQRNSSSDTPLHTALRAFPFPDTRDLRGRAAISALISHGADPFSITDAYGHSAFKLASMMTAFDLVTDLGSAIAIGHKRRVEDLLLWAANPNASALDSNGDRAGEPYLHEAIKLYYK
jgi:ankyrin repeat protein